MFVVYLGNPFWELTLGQHSNLTPKLTSECYSLVGETTQQPLPYCLQHGSWLLHASGRCCRLPHLAHLQAQNSVYAVGYCVLVGETSRTPIRPAPWPSYSMCQLVLWSSPVWPTIWPNSLLHWWALQLSQALCPRPTLAYADKCCSLTGESPKEPMRLPGRSCPDTGGNRGTVLLGLLLCIALTGEASISSLSCFHF